MSIPGHPRARGHCRAPASGLLLATLLAGLAMPAVAGGLSEALGDMMAAPAAGDPLAGPSADIADIAAEAAGVRRVIDGRGDRVLMLEGPFELAWRSFAGSFALRIETAEPAARGGDRRGGAYDIMRTVQRTTLNARAHGRAEGRLRVVVPGPHRVEIGARGAWKLIVRGGG